MEHILPAEVKRAPFTIPFLLQNQSRWKAEHFLFHDGLEFQDAPLHHLLDFTPWMNRPARLIGGSDLRFTAEQWDSIPSYLQGWLYFGLMGLLLGLDGDEDGGTRTPSGYPEWWGDYVCKVDTADEGLGYERRITTLFLSENIRDWVDGQSKCDIELCHFGFNVVSLVRKNMERMMTKDVPELSPAKRREIKLVLLGIALLECALRIAVFQQQHTDITWRGGDQEDDTRFGALADLMREAQWCPRVVAVLQDGFDLELQCIFFALGTTRAGPGHGQCTEHMCERTKALSGTFVPKHTQHPGNCADLHIDEEKLASVIQGGATPVVRLVRVPKEGGYDWHLEICGTTTSRPYVAVSHVWADGLGNPDANAIPACQAESLFNSLSQMQHGLPRIFDRWFRGPWQFWYQRLPDGPYGAQIKPPTPLDLASPRDCSLPFWLDTLCIPVANQSLRNQSIGDMYSTYRDALATLVLDRDLKTLPVETHPQSVIARLLLSDWRQRLWTYQEAALSRELYIAGDGCTWPLAALMAFNADFCRFDSRVPWTEYPHKLRHRLSKLVLNEDLRWMTLFSSLGSLAQRLLCAVGDRVTSRQDDEAIVIASALRMDTSRLSQLCGDEQMAQLAREFGDQVPLNMLFSSSPRISTAGFTWMPRSVLGSGGVYHTIVGLVGSDKGEDFTYLSGTASPHGLEVEMPTFDFGTRLRAGLEASAAFQPLRNIIIFTRGDFNFMMDIYAKIWQGDEDFEQLLERPCCLLLRCDFVELVMRGLLVVREPDADGNRSTAADGRNRGKSLALAKVYCLGGPKDKKMSFSRARWLLV
jgi:hypothetical protein